MDIPMVVPLTSRIARLADILAAESGGEETFTADVAASTTLSNVSSFDGLEIGQTLTGTGIPAATTIVAMDSGASTITMSNAGLGVHAGATITSAFSPPSPIKLRLFSAPFTVDDLTTEADLTPLEADFDGYTPGGVAITWTSGYITPDLTPSNESQLVQWIMPSPVVVGNTIYGGWVRNASGILLGFNLPSPVALTDPGNALKIMLEDSYPPGLPSQQVVP